MLFANLQFIIKSYIYILYNFLNRNDHENFRGVEKYEGYAVDSVQKLSELMNFEYDFMIVNGNGKYNPTTKTWDGIIGKLIDHVSNYIP